jgi:hypothetical protein
VSLDEKRQRYEELNGTPQQRANGKIPTASFEKKLAIVRHMLHEYLVLRDVLQDRSARSFHDLHPHLVAQREPTIVGQDLYATQTRPWEPEIKHGLSVPDTYSRSPTVYSDYDPNNYVDLFEAVWRGDIIAVKRLTLLPGEDQEGSSCPPLTIAVVDRHQDSPFTIALSLGHLELARTIYWIAEAQYQPSMNRTNRRKRSKLPSAESTEDEFTESESEEFDFDDSEESPEDDFEAEDIRDGDSEADSSGSVSESSSVADIRMCQFEELAALLADDNIAIEDVREVQKSVASPISPACMFTWQCPKTVKQRHKKGASEHFGRQEIRPRNMPAMALYRNDLDLLSCILDLAEKPIKPVFDQCGEEVKPGSSYGVNDHAFRVALQSAHPETLSMLIQRTAAGIPLDELAEEESKPDEKHTTQYETLEQGNTIERCTPPLLQAANLGSLANVKWLLSGASLARYEQFAADNSDDHSANRISVSRGGFKGTIKQFLESRSKLAVLCCVMSKSGSEGIEILDQLIKFMPDAINARSSTGDTPLLIAFRFQNLQAARMLVSAGADQTARNNDGDNVLHSLFGLMTNCGGGNGSSYVPEVANDKHYTHMRAMMDLLDPQLLPIICTQRTHKGQYRWYTPLASLLCHACTPNSFLVPIARMILEYSKGAELDLLDNEGNTPCTFWCTKIYLRHTWTSTVSLHCYWDYALIW